MSLLGGLFGCSQECDALVKAVVDNLADTVPLERLNKELQVLLGNVWLYGYAQKMWHCAQTPFGLSMLKLLSAGEVSMILMPIAKLIPALKVMTGQDDHGIEDVRKRVVKFEAEDLDRLAAAGCVCQHVTQKPGEIVLIPPGWLCCEAATSGVLIYGIRRSFVTRGEASVQDYSELIGSYSIAKKPMGKMKEILPFMKVDSDGEA